MTLWDIYEKSAVFRVMERESAGREKASMFVCGTLLKEVFCPDIKILYPKTDMTWEQLWYLICLYHDRRFEQGTLWKFVCSEEMTRQREKIWEARNIEAHTRWLPMKVSFSPSFVFGNEGIIFSNGVHVNESPVSEMEIRDAFCYRNVCSDEGGMDHGIVGGLLLYETLLLLHWKNKDEIKGNDLCLYSYLANLLMVHRFLKGRDDASLKNNPFLFFLVLAEALEPMHYVSESYKSMHLLNAIGVEICEGELILYLKKNKIPAHTYISCLSAAARKTGMQCIFCGDLSEIRIKMKESPIIDELFI